MKFKAFLKLTAKSTIKNLPSILLTFSIFPIFLGLIIGYFQKDIFTPSVEDPIMKVNIVDEDNTIQSKNLIKFLNSEEIKKIIEIDEVKYELIIPNGYETSLLNSSESNVEIHVKKDGSVRRAEILGDIIDRYNAAISEGLYIEDKIEKASISQEEIETIGRKIFAAYNTELIENKLIKNKKSLTSYEHTSIIYLSYMLLLVLLSSNSGKEGTDEFHNRIMSTPITKIQYFKYNQGTFYFFALFLNILYVMAYRISGLSFQGSLLILILIILAQTLLISSLSGFITAFFKKKFITPILSVLMIVQLLLGLTSPNVESTNFEFLKLIAKKYSPDILISSTFRNYLVYNNLDSIKFNLILIILVSVALYILSLLKLKWGGNYENPEA